MTTAAIDKERSLSVASYDPVARILHWLTVLLVLAEYIVGSAMPHIRLGTPFVLPTRLHLALGSGLVLVVLARILWRLTHRPPPLPVLPTWQKRLADATQFLLYVTLILMPLAGWASASDQSQSVSTAATPGSAIEYPPPRKSLAAQTFGDAEAYFAAPLHWNARDWEYFGGALAAIAIAHHYDSQARTHFDSDSKSPLGPANSGSLTDALPGAALFLGTWGYAHLIGSHAGESEAWNMLESGGLSLVSTYALKYIVRRPRPDATTDPNHFFGGGDSFPSEHVTAAFAVGTVLAESGNPEFRWIRRTIGYGVGIGTAYLRMKHNAHWLSDTVAGAALGMASAHFVMNRSAQRQEESATQMSLVPVQGGVMLAFSTDFPN